MHGWDDAEFSRPVTLEAEEKRRSLKARALIAFERCLEPQSEAEKDDADVYHRAVMKRLHDLHNGKGSPETLGVSFWGLGSNGALTPEAKAEFHKLLNLHKDSQNNIVGIGVNTRGQVELAEAVYGAIKP